MMYRYVLHITASIAQLVERPIRVREALGSNPSGRVIPKTLKMVPVLLGIMYIGNTKTTNNSLSEETLNWGPLYGCFTLGRLKNQSVSLEWDAFCIMHYPPKPKITKTLLEALVIWETGTYDK